MYLKFKTWLTKTLGLHVYRKGTPLGLSLRNDLDRLVPGFSPRTVFDVGANVGQTALQFWSFWPQAHIHSFEPVRDTFEKLTANTRTAHTSISVYNLALSSRSGGASIRLAGNSVFATLEDSPIAPQSLSGETEPIVLDTLSDWCASHNIDRIDLLKIDAEGHDLEVLRGADQLFHNRQIDAVLIEIHLGACPGPQFAEISAWLGSRRFILAGIYDQHAWTDRQLFFANFLFLHDTLLAQ